MGIKGALMGAARKFTPKITPNPAPRGDLIPATPRGGDRRRTARDESADWRVNPRSYGFLGIEFDPLTPLQVLERCRGVTTAHAFRYLATPNVDHVVRHHRDPDTFAPLYRDAWLCVCDSRVLELLAQGSGLPLQAVPGSTLTQTLFDTTIEPDEPVNIIGGDAELAEELRRLYGLERLHQHIPPMGLRQKPDAVAACAAWVAAHPARFTLICVGSPQQEMVAQACARRGDCAGLGLCVGASLEFVTGRTKRAPEWVQTLRLEWLHRLASEPGRLWKRYLVEGPRVFAIWLGWLVRRRG